MAVEFITSSSTKENFYLYVAGKYHYEKYWLPKAESKSLFYLSMLGTGITVNKDNVDQIIEELVIMADEIPSYGDIDVEDRTEWLGQVNRLLNALMERRNDEDLDAGLG